MARVPRGIRLNNGGNIRHSSARWQGMAAVQTDRSFVQFTTPFYGLRALCKCLLTYQRKHGLRTVSAIISRWAPPIENNTNAYAAAVAKGMGVNLIDSLDLSKPDILARLCREIVRHENGLQPYSAKVLLEAADAALKR